MYPMMHPHTHHVAMSPLIIPTPSFGLSLNSALLALGFIIAPVRHLTLTFAPAAARVRAHRLTLNVHVIDMTDLYLLSVTTAMPWKGDDPACCTTHPTHQCCPWRAVRCACWLPCAAVHVLAAWVIVICSLCRRAIESIDVVCLSFLGWFARTDFSTCTCTCDRWVSLCSWLRIGPNRQRAWIQSIYIRKGRVYKGQTAPGRGAELR